MLPLAQEAKKPLLHLEFDALFEETGLPLALMGMLVVFTALLVLIFCISMLPRLMKLLDRAIPSKPHGAPVKKKTPEKAAVDSNKAPGEIPEEIVAVIAAAVAETIGKPHRIIRTRQLTAAELSWTLQGRIRHHASHKLQPHDR